MHEFTIPNKLVEIQPEPNSKPECGATLEIIFRAIRDQTTSQTTCDFILVGCPLQLCLFCTAVTWWSHYKSMVWLHNLDLASRVEMCL